MTFTSPFATFSSGYNTSNVSVTSAVGMFPRNRQRRSLLYILTLESEACEGRAIFGHNCATKLVECQQPAHLDRGRVQGALLVEVTFGIEGLSVLLHLGLHCVREQCRRECRVGIRVWGHLALVTVLQMFLAVCARSRVLLLLKQVLNQRRALTRHVLDDNFT